MRVDIIYDNIMDVPLLYELYIINGYICGTQNETTAKFLSVISTVSAQELSLRTNRWMC